MLAGIETILVAKPVGLFFLKQLLEEHTTVTGLERIVRKVNGVLAGHREVSPTFSFQKVGHVYQMHVWANAHGRGVNTFIDTVEMTILTNTKLNSEWLVIRDIEAEHENDNHAPAEKEVH